jgi:hypothetical protein
MCGDDNRCQLCGSPGFPCCEGNFCDETACGSNGLCHDLKCDQSGQCEPCGSIGKPCCLGDSCTVNATCDAEGFCVDCGGLDELACSNNQCDYWRAPFVRAYDYTFCQCDGRYLPEGGYCRNPFKVNKDTSIDVCTPSEAFLKNINPSYGFATVDFHYLLKDSLQKEDPEHPNWCYWFTAF